MPELDQGKEPGSPWPGALVAVAAVTIAILIVFRNDVHAAATLWVDHSTYNYCIIIPFISAWLLWRRRSELASIAPAPSVLGVGLAAGWLLVWWLANAAVIAEVRQLAVIGILHGAWLALLGWPACRRMLFPFFYLFLMVPTGTALLGPLQAVTTRLSTALLQSAGIPVYVEGNLIEVPHGVYMVAPGCAGLNFLLATSALSLLYANLVYAHLAKRVAAVLAGIAVSVLSNAVRVFAIIWLAEFTERRIDIVDDHLLYGWGMYGVVIIAVMAAGFRYADEVSASPPPDDQSRDAAPHPARLLLAFGAIVLLVLAVGGNFGNEPRRDLSPIAVDLPRSIGGWRAVAIDGQEIFGDLRADVVSRQAFLKGDRRVDVTVGWYWDQYDGHKVTDALMAGTLLRFDRRPAVVGDARVEVNVYRGQGTASPFGRTAWVWFWVAGRQTGDPLWARLLGVQGHLSGDTRAAVIGVAAEEGLEPATASAVLADFLSSGRTLLSALDRAGRPAR